MPFDPANIEPAARQPETPCNAAVVECGICGRARFCPFEIAYEAAVVIASGQPTACGFCGDGTFR